MFAHLLSTQYSVLKEPGFFDLYDACSSVVFCRGPMPAGLPVYNLGGFCTAGACGIPSSEST